MAIIVNDPNKLPITILQVDMSKVPLFTKDFLDELTKRKDGKGGIKRDNYYLLSTESNISWLQPTKQLGQYHLLLRLLRIKKGFHYLMVINDKQDV